MFKRVQKRIRKREREEELGLDSEMKEVLGLQDTDSEESDSSSEDEGEGGSGFEDEEDGSSDGESQEDADEDQGDDIQDDEIMASAGDVPEDSDTDSEIEDSIPEMSVTEAVKDPVYVVSLQPQMIKACILCHGKLLKNNKMSEVHKASKAHNRRFSRFIELVGKAGPEADVRDLIRAMNIETKPASKPTDTDGAPSKRALKRKEKLAAVKAKRAAKKKAAERARRRIEERKKKNALGTDATNAEALSEPARKKRKVEREESPKDSSASPQKNEGESADVGSSGDAAPQTTVKTKRAKKDETAVLKDKKLKPGKKPRTKRPHKAKSLVVDTKIS